MRIYEGSPRQDWEEVLRSIGAFADRERIKELLLLELDAGFIVQGLALPRDSAWTESEGMLIKPTHELTDDEIGKLIDAAEAKRSDGPTTTPTAEIANFYEQAMRVIGAWLDAQQAARRLPLRAGRRLRASPPRLGDRGRRRRPPARRIHEGGHPRYDRSGTTAATVRVPLMKLFKILFVTIGALLAAMVIVPLTILAGLFVWLKLTEEIDDDDLEIDDAV